jgi:pimeloyl-ACP methyl ester carboxylesterase/diadenosine tetraphosphate (Ap4A) HIT family hydrolase
MPERDTTITLRDGRIMAYTEHGDLSGKPVFFLHGNPSSRLMRHPDETIVEKLGARIITPDRPGYGRSDFHPNRKLLDYPDDIIQLADALGIDKFAIFGVSAGGPYVAACAYKLPKHITKAAIVSGAAPMNRRGAFEGMHNAWKTAFRASRDLPPWMLRAPLWIQSRSANRTPEQALTNFASMLSDADREKLRRPDIRARVMLSRAESTRQGHKGWVHEAKIIMSSWGFRLENIKVPIHLWYWEDDEAIPPQMGRYLESKIPNTSGHFFSDGGHLSIYDHWGDIIEALIVEDPEWVGTSPTEPEQIVHLITESTDCLVCQKHRGAVPVPGGVIYEDDLIYISHASIPDGKATAYLGALLIEPKRHIPSLASLTNAEAQRIGLYVAHLSRALLSGENVEHVYQFVTGHHVLHLHIWVIPRYPDTPREYWGMRVDEWPEAPKGGPEEIAALCERIRAEIQLEVIGER